MHTPIFFKVSQRAFYCGKRGRGSDPIRKLNSRSPHNASSCPHLRWHYVKHIQDSLIEFLSLMLAPTLKEKNHGAHSPTNSGEKCAKNERMTPFVESDHDFQ